MEGDASRPTVDIRRACQIIRVSRRTIYYYLKKGKIEYIRNAGGHVRIYVDSLWKPPEMDDQIKAEAVAYWRSLDSSEGDTVPDHLVWFAEKMFSLGKRRRNDVQFMAGGVIVDGISYFKR